MIGNDIIDRGYIRQQIWSVLLKDCKDDREYFKHLLWAQELITESLQDFRDDPIEELE